MNDVSNRTLALLLVTGIVIMLGSSVYTLNELNMGTTGYVNNVEGNVSLIVSNQVSIKLNTNVIDFGTGYINTSCDFVGANDYANLTASDNYYDTSDCWTGTEVGSNGFLVENNGNLNASISVRGSTNNTFFDGYAGSNDYGIQIRGRETDAGACIATLNTTWSDLSDNRTVCYDLKWDTDSSDEIGVDVQLRVPRDLGSGTYNASIVEFYAVQS